MSRWRLVADIGGTNLRLARAGPSALLSDIVSKPLKDGTELLDELRSFVCRFDADAIDGLVIAAAGPVDGQRIVLTNRPLVVDADVIGSAFGDIPVILMNDLQAVALSLPWLERNQVSPLIEVEASLAGPQLVVNIGTGFGAAILVPTKRKNEWEAVACEPGHMTFPLGFSPGDANLQEVRTIEDYLSGRTLCSVTASERVWHRTPQMPRGQMFGPRENPEFVRAFTELVGHVCGNLVLACGAWGGVFLSGSVVSRWRRRADIDLFAKAFRQKGPMSQRMSRVPVNEICVDNPALIGLAHLRN
jgi:glucokinase